MPLIRLLCATWLVAGAAAACRDGGSTSGPSSGGTADGGGDGGGSGGDGGSPAAPGWTVLMREDFETVALPSATFARDPVPDDGPFSDGGAFFEARRVTPPTAFRATQPFGVDGWLTVESYSRRADASFAEHASIAADPAGGANHVLRLRSPAHTDATVVRPTEPLPPRYRVSLRVGFAAFGDGKPGLNGYDGGETAEPWWPEDATSQNGFYWITILDAQPRPHNNTWIHHHRKVVVDSDNHYSDPPSTDWMEIWNGRAFERSGEHPIMMFALDGTETPDPKTGLPFLSHANGVWQPSGVIRAVDAYLPQTWYRVTVERGPSATGGGASYTVEISGRFASRPGEDLTYRATIDASAACVWHYPADAAEAAGAQRCTNEDAFQGAPLWPAGGTWPDWFMFGDPHVNYYEGEVFYDDVVLEVWRG